jgi:hypothetical protein
MDVDVQEKDLGWKTFPYKRSPILIQSDTFCIYRCGTTAPDKLITPTFFSEREIAEVYRNFGGERSLYRCLLTRRDGQPIRLMDIRMLRHWFVEELLQFVENNHPTTTPYALQAEQLPLSPFIIQCVLATLLVTGVLPFSHQRMYITRFPNLKGFFLPSAKDRFYALVEAKYFNSGFRLSDLEHDTKCVQMCRDIFGDVIDGYICPELYSPWHAAINGGAVIHDKFHQEMILFDPSKTVTIVPVSTESQKVQYAGREGLKKPNMFNLSHTPLSIKSQAASAPLNHHSASDHKIAQSFIQFETPPQEYKKFVAGLRAQVSKNMHCISTFPPSRSGGGTTAITLRTHELVQKLFAVLSKLQGK